MQATARAATRVKNLTAGLDATAGFRRCAHVTRTRRKIWAASFQGGSIAITWEGIYEIYALLDFLRRPFRDGIGQMSGHWREGLTGRHRPAPIRARHCPRPRRRDGQKFLQRLHDRAPGHPDHGGPAGMVKLGREHALYEQNVVWPAFPAGSAARIVTRSATSTGGQESTSASRYSAERHGAEDHGEPSGDRGPQQ
jgi:hypothetical protein